MNSSPINEDNNFAVLSKTEESNTPTPSGVKRSLASDDNTYSSPPVAKKPNLINEEEETDNMSVHLQKSGTSYSKVPGIIPYVPGNNDSFDGEEIPSETIEIMDRLVGLIIGKGGEQIQNIQNVSGCTLKMTNSPNPRNNREITLIGSQDSIARAKELIFDIVNNAPQNSPNGGSGQGGKTITSEIAIPGRKCGLIIGKSGETIRNLQQQTGAKMMLVQDSHLSGDVPKTLRISGSYECVEAGRKAVMEILTAHDAAMAAQGVSSPTPQQQQQHHQHSNSSSGAGSGIVHAPRMNPQQQGDNFVGEVIVPKTAVGMIIGKSGDTIKRLAVDTGAKVQFKPDSNPEGSDRTAVIQGTADQISHATRLISEIVNKCGGGKHQETVFMKVPANKTGLVIGKGGETIKQLIQESTAHIELARDYQCNPDEKAFQIKGVPYAIHTAQHLIRIKIGEVAPGTPMPSFNGTLSSGPAGNMYQQGYSNYSNNQPGAGMQNQWNQQYYPNQGGNYRNDFAGMGQPQQPTATGQGAGQADYSAEWAMYFRSIGMNDQAEKVEQQMKNARGGSSGPGGQSGSPSSFQSYDNSRKLNGQQPISGQGNHQYSGYKQ